MKTIIYTTVSLQLNKITTNVLKFKKRSKIDREIDRIKFWSVDGTAAGSSPNQPGHFVSGCRLNGNHASRLSCTRACLGHCLCTLVLNLPSGSSPRTSSNFAIVAIKDDGRNRIGKRDSRDSRDLYLLFHGVMRIESREGDLSRGIDLISLTARVLLVDSRDLLNWSRFAFFDSRTALFFPFYDIYMYVYM